MLYFPDGRGGPGGEPCGPAAGPPRRARRRLWQSSPGDTTSSGGGPAPAASSPASGRSRPAPPRGGDPGAGAAVGLGSPGCPATAVGLMVLPPRRQVDELRLEFCHPGATVPWRVLEILLYSCNFRVLFQNGVGLGPGRPRGDVGGGPGPWGRLILAGAGPERGL